MPLLVILLNKHQTQVCASLVVASASAPHCSTPSDSLRCCLNWFKLTSIYTDSKLRSGKITRSLEAISFPTLKPGPMTPVVRDAQAGKRSPEPRFVYRHSHAGCLSLPCPGLSGVADTGGGGAGAHKGLWQLASPLVQSGYTGR